MGAKELARAAAAGEGWLSGEGGDVKICLCSGGGRITQPTGILWEGLVRETFCTKQLAEPSVGLLVFMK